MSRVFVRTRVATQRPTHKTVSMGDLQTVMGAGLAETRSLHTARALLGKQERQGDDVQQLLDIIDNQRAALEDRTAVIKSLQKDVNTLGKMLIAERKRASHYCKMFSLTENELASFRSHQPQELQTLHSFTPIDLTTGLQSQFSAETSPVPLKARKLKRKIPSFKPQTGTKWYKPATSRLDYNELTQEKPLSIASDLQQTVSDLKATVDQYSAQIQSLQGSEEQYRCVAKEQEGRCAEMEKRIQTLTEELANCRKDKSALEEKIKSMTEKHAEVLASVEHFRKRHEEEQLRLKKELMLATDALHNLRYLD